MAEDKDLKSQITEHETMAKNESLSPDVREHHRAQAIQKKSRKSSDDTERTERTGNK